MSASTKLSRDNAAKSSTLLCLTYGLEMAFVGLSVGELSVVLNTISEESNEEQEDSESKVPG